MACTDVHGNPSKLIRLGDFDTADREAIEFNYQILLDRPHWMASVARGLERKLEFDRGQLNDFLAIDLDTQTPDDLRELVLIAGNMMQEILRMVDKATAEIQSLEIEEE